MTCSIGRKHRCESCAIEGSLWLYFCHGKVGAGQGWALVRQFRRPWPAWPREWLLERQGVDGRVQKPQGTLVCICQSLACHRSHKPRSRPWGALPLNACTSWTVMACRMWCGTQGYADGHLARKVPRLGALRWPASTIAALWRRLPEAP